MDGVGEELNPSTAEGKTGFDWEDKNYNIIIAR
jgi:hypothetical protein